jgi:hypothetical protein
VTEVLPLEIDLGAAEAVREPLGKIQRCWPSDIVLKIIGEFPLKAPVSFRLRVFALQFQEGGHQGLGDIPTPINPETALAVRHTRGEFSVRHGAGSINRLTEKRQP